MLKATMKKFVHWENLHNPDDPATLNDWLPQSKVEWGQNATSARCNSIYLISAYNGDEGGERELLVHVDETDTEFTIEAITLSFDGNTMTIYSRGSEPEYQHHWAMTNPL